MSTDRFRCDHCALSGNQDRNTDDDYLLNTVSDPQESLQGEVPFLGKEQPASDARKLNTAVKAKPEDPRKELSRLKERMGGA